MTIIKRADLGRPLTWDELDDNFREVDELTASASAAVSSASAFATAAAGSATNSLNSANSATASAADAAASAIVAINALMNSTFEPNSFDFTTGGTLDTTDRNKAVYNPADNNWYSWAGTLPKVVAAGTDPTADSNWKPRTDQLLRQELSSADGLKLIGACASVAQLRNTEPEQPGQRIRTIAYYSAFAPEMPRGGGDFEYDADDTTTPDDGILTIVTTNGARWKRVLQRLYLTCFDAGVYPSGSDDTAALNVLFATVASYRLTRGRFQLDMLGLEFQSTQGTTVEFDPTKIELCNFTIKNTFYTSTTAFAIVRAKPSLAWQNGVGNVQGNVENLKIADNTRATTSPVTALHLTSDLNGAFSCVVFNGINIASSQNGIAFGNHCYLVTFNDAHVTAYSDLTDAITAGLETSITDAGENYVFNRPIFTGTQVFNWNNIEGEFNMYGASLDFVRGGVNSRSGFVWGMYGGHIEFNSSYDRWFESSGVSTVIFKPSKVLCGSGSATDFFYDSSAGNNLKVDFDVGSWGGNTVGALINTRLRSDTCASIPWYQPPVRGRLNRYLVDGTFTQSTLVDHWFVDANPTRTSRLESDTTTLTKGTVVNGSGDTVGCMTMTKRSTIGPGTPSGAHLCLRVPRGDTSPHVKFKYKATDNTPIAVTVRLVTILSIDSNGVPTYGSRVVTSASANLTASTTEAEYTTSTGLNVDSSYQPYDFILVSISMFSAGTNSAPVSIYDVLVNKIG